MSLATSEASLEQLGTQPRCCGSLAAPGSRGPGRWLRGSPAFKTCFLSCKRSGARAASPVSDQRSAVSRRITVHLTPPQLGRWGNPGQRPDATYGYPGGAWLGSGLCPLPARGPRAVCPYFLVSVPTQPRRVGARHGSWPLRTPASMSLSSLWVLGSGILLY